MTNVCTLVQLQSNCWKTILFLRNDFQDTVFPEIVSRSVLCYLIQIESVETRLKSDISYIFVPKIEDFSSYVAIAANG